MKAFISSGQILVGRYLFLFKTTFNVCAVCGHFIFTTWALRVYLQTLEVFPLRNMEFEMSSLKHPGIRCYLESKLMSLKIVVSITSNFSVDISRSVNLRNNSPRHNKDTLCVLSLCIISLYIHKVQNVF